MSDAVSNLERLLAWALPGPWQIDGPYWIRGGPDPYWIRGGPEAVDLVTSGERRDPVCLDVPDDDTRENLALIAAAPLLAQHCLALAQALRLTAEYADLPAVEGWSWFDALAAFERDFGDDDA